MMKHMHLTALGTAVILHIGCTTTGPDGSTASKASAFNEAYEIYPAAAGNTVPRHLLRSHTTAILVRPVSSASDLCHRGADQVWDWIRRLETRLVRFPTLHTLESPAAVHGLECMDLEEWERYLDRLTGRPSTTAELKLVIGGEAFYATLTESISNAYSSIDLQTYLFDNDDIARSIADQLRAKSKEVDVRIIFDGLGTYLSHTATAPSQPEDTDYIENMPRYLCEGSDIRLRVIPNIWLSGNHVKSIIFDRRTAFIGESFALAFAGWHAVSRHCAQPVLLRDD